MRPSLQALGRLKTGAMNQTETLYAAHLDLRRMAGEILWWKFEPFKLRIADNCFLTPDFGVMLANGELEAHDVKGSRHIYQDDAKVKMKVASREFPMRFYACFPRKKSEGGGWDLEEV